MSAAIRQVHDAAGSAAALVLALAAACASSELAEPPDGVGVPTPVLVLDAEFVQFEHERIPFDLFLVKVRERARAAHGEPKQLPSLLVSVAPGAGDVSRRLSGMIEQLRGAGVREIAFD